MDPAERNRRFLAVVLMGTLALGVIVGLTVSPRRTDPPASRTVVRISSVNRVSSVNWRPALAEKAHAPISVRSITEGEVRWHPALAEEPRVEIDGIEQAERLNEQMMRRYQESWRRSLGSPLPPAPALPPAEPRR